MADKKISELNSLTGSALATGDLVAVVDTSVFYRKPFRTNSARISFSVKPQDVYMIYDGIAKVIDTEVIPDPNAIFREIWKKAGDRLDSLTTV